MSAQVIEMSLPSFDLRFLDSPVDFVSNPGVENISNVIIVLF